MYIYTLQTGVPLRFDQRLRADGLLDRAWFSTSIRGTGGGCR